jgi:RNA polymerase sigma factor (sigma-70 family)
MGDSRANLDVFLALRRELVNYASTITGDRVQAEDIVQEAYIRFMPREAASASSIQQPGAYLYRIVRNLALDLIRSRAREQEQQQMPPDWLIPAALSDPAEACRQQMALERLADALQALPEASRRAVEMHRFGGCTLVQIAAALQMSLTSAHRLLRDALVRLARELADHHDAEPAPGGSARDD